MFDSSQIIRKNFKPCYIFSLPANHVLKTKTMPISESVQISWSQSVHKFISKVGVVYNQPWPLTPTIIHHENSGNILEMFQLYESE